MIQIRRIFNNKSAVISNYSEATLAKRVNEVGALQITLPMDEPIAGIGYNLIDSLVYSVDFTEYANSIYIGGSGSRLNRVVEPVTGEIVGRFGLAEKFDSDNDGLDREALRTLGQSLLYANRPKRYFSGGLIANQSKIGFGDKFALPFPNVSVEFNQIFVVEEFDARGRVSVVNDTIYLLKKAEFNNADLTATLVCEDAMSLLRQRVVAYANGTGQAAKTLQADDMLKALVRENFTGDRAVTNFMVQANKSLAPTISKEDMAWRTLLIICQEIAQASAENGTPLYFDIVADIGRNLEFRTYIGQRGRKVKAGGLAGELFEMMVEGVSITIRGGEIIREATLVGEV